MDKASKIKGIPARKPNKVANQPSLPAPMVDKDPADKKLCPKTRADANLINWWVEIRSIYFLPFDFGCSCSRSWGLFLKAHQGARTKVSCKNARTLKGAMGLK